MFRASSKNTKETKLTKDYGDQHYIPVFILSRLANASGKLYYLDWDSVGRHAPIKERIPESCFYRKLSTSFRDHEGRWNHDTEKLFSRRENEIAEFTNGLIEALNEFGARADYNFVKETLFSFQHMTMKRCPEFLDEDLLYQRATEYAISRSKGLDEKGDEIRALAFDEKTKRNQIAQLRALSWPEPPSDALWEIAEKTQIQFLDARKSKAKFAIGSKIVGRGSVFPISSNWAFRFIAAGFASLFIQPVDQLHVEQFNNAMFLNSNSAFASSSKRELQRIIARHQATDRVKRLLSFKAGKAFMRDCTKPKN